MAGLLAGVAGQTSRPCDDESPASVDEERSDEDDCSENDDGRVRVDLLMVVSCMNASWSGRATMSSGVAPASAKRKAGAVLVISNSPTRCCGSGRSGGSVGVPVDVDKGERRQARCRQCACDSIGCRSSVGFGEWSGARLSGKREENEPAPVFEFETSIRK